MDRLSGGRRIQADALQEPHPLDAAPRNSILKGCADTDQKGGAHCAGEIDAIREATPRSSRALAVPVGHAQ